ncbi:PepSY domain-containing protein [Bowmanella denitrificans]|uniref:PepSY domain-containing protein n=1 Tax=Bowmanella denitrificans TaxID=366582 RepID=A0ABP3GY38_9ALTE
MSTTVINKSVPPPTDKQNGRFYQAVWRWHYYAGLLVMPFMLILLLSGLLMLLSKPPESLFAQSSLQVEENAKPLPASQLLAKVRQRYPDASVKLYIAPHNASSAAQFYLQTAAHHQGGHAGHGAGGEQVFIHPYNGEILASQQPAHSLYNWLKDLHGSLFLGKLGDALIETAAGLGILMVLSGLYLAWPRTGWRSLSIHWRPASRSQWRQIHKVVGLLVTLPLLFFLLSGLAWTNVWGGMLVQPWGSLPGTSFKGAKSAEQHQSMNHAGMHQVPWAMEQTLMPASAGRLEALDLDQVTAIAARQGLSSYRVHFPLDDSGVWTISATTMAGDINNPLQERIVHLDKSNAEVLADIRFADYPLMGQAMAASIPFHQGDLGVWNWLLNVLLVCLILLLTISGLILWWKRRPKRRALAAPPQAKPSYSNAAAALMLLVALCFPLSALALLGIILLDWLVVVRRPALG